MYEEKKNSKGIEAVRSTSAPIWRGKIVLVTGSDVEPHFLSQKIYEVDRIVGKIMSYACVKDEGDRESW